MHSPCVPQGKCAHRQHAHNRQHTEPRNQTSKRPQHAKKRRKEKNTRGKRQDIVVPLRQELGVDLSSPHPPPSPLLAPVPGAFGSAKQTKNLTHTHTSTQRGPAGCDQPSGPPLQQAQADGQLASTIDTHGRKKTFTQICTRTLEHTQKREGTQEQESGLVSRSLPRVLKLHPGVLYRPAGGKAWPIRTCAQKKRKKTGTNSGARTGRGPASTTKRVSFNFKVCRWYCYLKNVSLARWRILKIKMHTHSHSMAYTRSLSLSHTHLLTHVHTLGPSVNASRRKLSRPKMDASPLPYESKARAVSAAAAVFCSRRCPTLVKKRRKNSKASAE